MKPPEFDPLQLNVPSEIVTDRLLLRVPRAGDSALIMPAVLDSLAELRPWMTWVHPARQEEVEQWVRHAAANFILGKEFTFSLYLPGTQTCLGTCGLFRVNWDVPRMEIGYWLRTPYCGRGLMTEAIHAISGYAFGPLRANRVELRCDERNARSAAAAARAGYQLEGTLRNESRGAQGELRNMRLYSRVGGPLT